VSAQNDEIADINENGRRINEKGGGKQQKVCIYDGISTV